MSGPGTLLANRYRLDDRIGGGGMGEVWRATDQVLGRVVAVKLMRPELVAEPGFADRFLAEARTMATIRHRGVVAVHDYHGDAAGAFLVMEYVEGESLSHRLYRLGRLEPARAMALVAQAAEALQAAHDRDVVHRDIKPGNLLVTADDSLVLTDFGIARSAASTPLTATGAVIGTPSYLAPEQVLGQPAGPRSDVYALGVVAYECLTGRRPFEGENPFEIAMKRLREPPPPMGGDVPAAVVAVVERALAADPEQRWESATALARAAREPTVPGAGAPPAPTRHDYRPGRAAAPRPPQPPAPTYLERPASTPYQAPQQPPAAPPPAQPPPPPWTAPPTRPIVVVLASVLLLLAAVGLLGYGAATLSVLEQGIEAASDVYGSDFEQWRDPVGLTGLVTTGGLLLLGLLYLLLAALVYRGRPSARGWSITLAVPLLCCCAPCWWYGQTGDWTELDGAADLADELAATLPGWYQPLAGLSMVTGLTALLLALVLLMTPPAGRFFRRQRAAFYYPHHPYYYGYPPRP